MDTVVEKSLKLSHIQKMTKNDSFDMKIQIIGYIINFLDALDIFGDFHTVCDVLFFFSFVLYILLKMLGNI